MGYMWKARVTGSSATGFVFTENYVVLAQNFDEAYKKVRELGTGKTIEKLSIERGDFVNA